MKILITGAKGFIGKNLAYRLLAIQRKLDKSFLDIDIEKIYGYDLDNSEAELDAWSRDCDIVYHLAGINRPKETSEFMTGNYEFSDKVLKYLEKNKNSCPIMLSSSIQASLEGRFANSDYGKSKLAAEELLFEYGKKHNNKVYVYRFPNVFGKWCRPNYNSVVATFCNNMANDLGITINDPNVELNLVYIDDLVNELLALLRGNATVTKSQNDKIYYGIKTTYNVTVGRIAELLKTYKDFNDTKTLPEFSIDSFESKLMSTYLSYLPQKKMELNTIPIVDDRGSFTEILKSENVGQISINIIKPGKTKGLHYHNSKWEIFYVISGEAEIQERNLNTNKTVSFKLSGNELKGILMLPGWTHSITNTSKNSDTVVLIWGNEIFDENKADTYREMIRLN